MSDPTVGFCIKITHLRQEQRAGISFSRTVSNYVCLWNNVPINGDPMTGQTVERGGPGDNTNNGKKKHLRIAAGSYPLKIEDGNHYRTYDYEENHLLPALLLGGTNKRSGILIHPCHDAEHQYLSSIGCINPAVGLTDANSRVDLANSKERVIAIIATLKSKLGAEFPKSGTIPNAMALILDAPELPQ